MVQKSSPCHLFLPNGPAQWTPDETTTAASPKSSGSFLGEVQTTQTFLVSCFEKEKGKMI